MKRKVLLTILALLLCAVVVVAEEPIYDYFVYLPVVVGGRGGTATPTLTPTPTPVPTDTPTPTPTVTPTPGTVILPTPTPAPCGYVSGNLLTDTTWIEDCTYIVTGDVGVPEGATLTIEPGVSVLFNRGESGLSIIAVGTLTAVGTEAKPILFAPSGDLGWTAIEIRNDSSVFDHCIVQGATFGLNLYGPRLLVTNSVFENNTYTIYSHSYRARAVTVSYSRFENNAVAFWPRINGTITITHNTIAHNGIGVDAQYIASSYIHYNNIYSNTTNVKAGGGDMDASHNWWGTVNTVEIDTGIYDYYDNVLLGQVLYQPIAVVPY